jgi:hypothetical protein
VTTLDILLAAGFALAVTGGALLHPAVALGIAAAFLVGLAVVHDRRTPPEQPQ